MTAPRLASPRPSQRPIVVQIDSAAGSPSPAAAVTTGPVRPSSEPASSSIRAAVAGESTASSRASRASARPEAYISQHPRFPQAHSRPSGTTVMCPYSQAMP